MEADLLIGALLVVGVLLGVFRGALRQLIIVGAWLVIFIVSIWLLRFPPLVLGGLAFGFLGLRYLLVRDANYGLSRASNEVADYLIGRIEGAIAEARRTRIVAPAS